MINLTRGSFLILILMFLFNCSRTNFMGAQKYIHSTLYTERWYLNTEYNKKNIPKGTGFYGTAAEKVKDKFIIRYYVSEEDFSDDDIEIPSSDMWRINHNGKNDQEQDDNSLFFYVKNPDGEFIKAYDKNDRFDAISKECKLLPIKACAENNWCELYPTMYNNSYFVKKSILYKGLNEVEKKMIELEKIKVIKVNDDWITPSEGACAKNSGYLNSRLVCKATFEEGENICKDMSARLPTIEELEDIFVTCGGIKREKKKNILNDSFTNCFMDKGFGLESEPYLSSTEFSHTVVNYKGVVRREYRGGYYSVMYITNGYTAGYTSTKSYKSILCRKNN